VTSVRCWWVFRSTWLLIRSAGKGLFELERAKKQLDSLCAEQKTHIEELEDELQTAEDAKLRLEVNMQAIRSQLERDVQAKSEELEDVRRTLMKQVKSLEDEIEDEKRQRALAHQAKKKLEMDLQSSQEQLEEATKMREESQKQVKKLQQQVRDSQHELEVITELRDQIAAQAKESDKRILVLSGETENLKIQLEQAEKSRRAAEQERDEAVNDTGAAQAAKHQIAELKRKYETEIARLNEEIEEAENDANGYADRIHRAESQVATLQTENTNLADALSKAEGARVRCVCVMVCDGAV
jgi:myosin heavy chain 9/10/11/14